MVCSCHLVYNTLTSQHFSKIQPILKEVQHLAKELILCFHCFQTSPMFHPFMRPIAFFVRLFTLYTPTYYYTHLVTNLVPGNSPPSSTTCFCAPQNQFFSGPPQCAYCGTLKNVFHYTILASEHIGRHRAEL